MRQWHTESRTWGSWLLSKNPACSKIGAVEGQVYHILWNKEVFRGPSSTLVKAFTLWSSLRFTSTLADQRLWEGLQQRNLLNLGQSIVSWTCVDKEVFSHWSFSHVLRNISGEREAELHSTACPLRPERILEDVSNVILSQSHSPSSPGMSSLIGPPIKVLQECVPALHWGQT